MKIGFPALGHGKERGILSADFTRNGYIGVYDTETENILVFNKEELGQGLTEWLFQEEIDTVITAGIQAMALKVFRELGISVYRASGTLLSLNVQLLSNNCLPLFTNEELYSAASCNGSACSSCRSGCN